MGRPAAVPLTRVGRPAAEHPVLDALDHPASIEVPVILREPVQSLQRPLQGLQAPGSRHGVFVTVGVLPVVAVGRQVAPEHVDADSKLQGDGVVEPEGCGGQRRWFRSSAGEEASCLPGEKIRFLPGMKSRSPGSSTHSCRLAFTNSGNSLRSGESMSRTSDLSPGGFRPCGFRKYKMSSNQTTLTSWTRRTFYPKNSHFLLSRASDKQQNCNR